MGLFLYHAKVWQGSGRFAEAVILRRGRVAEVGESRELCAAAADCVPIDCGGRTVIPGFFDPYLRLTRAFAPLPDKPSRWKDYFREALGQAGQAGITTLISPELGRELPDKVLPVLRQLYREERALPRLLFWQHGSGPAPLQPMRRWPAFAGRLGQAEDLPRLLRQGGLIALPAEDRAALERALAAIEQDPLPAGDLRRLALLGADCTCPAQLQTMGQQGLGVIAFPGQLQERLLACTGLPGVEPDTCCAWRTLSRLGAKVAFAGLDGCAPFGALQQAVCRREVTPTGEERPSREALTVEEALFAMTEGAAWMDFREQSLGRVAPGWQGDLQVLSADPFTCPPGELGQIRPVLVAAAGQLLRREI